MKKEFNETFKIQHQSHRLEIQTLEEKAKKELHYELEQIQKQQTLLLGIVSHVMRSSYCLIIYILRNLTFIPFIFFPIFWELRSLLISFFIPCNFNNIDLILFVNQALNCQQQNAAERVIRCTTFKHVLLGILENYT